MHNLDVPGYTATKVIGIGSFATVYLAHKNSNNELVAIKVIDRARLNKKLVGNLIGEIAVLREFRHPNIVSFHELQQNVDQIFIIMEYCRGGDLFTHLRKNNIKRLPEKLVQRIILDLKSAMQELRLNGLIHRDIKPQNILLVSRDLSATSFKLADFGFAKQFAFEELADTLCGSPLYMAPEVLGQEKYGPKVDLWSIGAIMYELLVGSPPFDASNHIQLLKMINESTDIRIPKHVSEEARDLLLRLLQKDPSGRCEFEDFFSHPFLNPGPSIIHPHSTPLASNDAAPGSTLADPTRTSEGDSELLLFKNAVYLIIHSDRITGSTQQKLLILQHAVLNLLKIRDSELRRDAVEILKDVRQIMMHGLGELDGAPFLDLREHLVNMYALSIVREAVSFERRQSSSKAIECYQRAAILLDKGHVHDLVKSRCHKLMQRSAESRR